MRYYDGWIRVSCFGDDNVTAVIVSYESVFIWTTKVVYGLTSQSPCLHLPVEMFKKAGKSWPRKCVSLTYGTFKRDERTRDSRPNEYPREFEMSIKNSGRDVCHVQTVMQRKKGGERINQEICIRT